MNPIRVHAIMSGKERSVSGMLARLAMSLAEPVYRAAVGVRNSMFNLGVRKPRKLPRPVISVGNITTGGTGKTPMVIEIVRRLMAMGQKPAVLLRGYGVDELRELDEAINSPRFTSAAAVSDSAPVAAPSTGPTWTVPIQPSPDRCRAGLAVIERRPDVTVFVLDDGFQHRQLHRDLNLLLIDATEPFGYRRTLPRGLLREPLKNMRRADVVVVTRADRVESDELVAVDRAIAEVTDKSPVAHAAHDWSGFNVYTRYLFERIPKDLPATAPRSVDADLAALKLSRVVAACGIGNPAAFRQTLQAHVGELANLHVFPDHHDYTQGDLVRVLHDAVERGAQAVVVTPKDYVKWRHLLPPFAADSDALPAVLAQPLPIYRPVLVMRFIDGGDALDALLRQSLT